MIGISIYVEKFISGMVIKDEIIKGGLCKIITQIMMS